MTTPSHETKQEPAAYPAAGDVCPECSVGQLTREGRIRSPFGDLAKYTCPACVFETVGPLPEMRE